MAAQTLDTPYLIIGAGPAGSAAAITLARAGKQVTLVDMRDFPREKVCGDGLITDSLNALQRLGIELPAEGYYHSKGVLMYSPNGKYCEFDTEALCYPRIDLDLRLLEAAKAAGVDFRPHYRLRRVEQADGRFGAVEFVHTESKESLTVRAEQLLLATGARSEPLKLFGVCQRERPSAIAARAYFRVPAAVAREFDKIIVVYHQAILPAYGWIFPQADNTYNIGVWDIYRKGDDGKGGEIRSVNELWKVFIETFPPAVRLLANAEQLGPLKGAPMRLNLEGADFYKQNLLVIGEAAGTTYAFSGEGIGKALESGILAAECLLEAAPEATPEQVGARYAKRLVAQCAHRFRTYEVAQHWLSKPFLCNLVTRQVQRKGYLKRQMEGIFEERVDCEAVFSVPSLIRSFVS